MGFGKSKWAERISELQLPRPRFMDLPDLDTARTEDNLSNSYRTASSGLSDQSQHVVRRWEAVMEYAEDLETYSRILLTHAATADARLIGENPLEIDEALRQSAIDVLTSEPGTRSNGLALSLSVGTYIGAMAVALTAFAVKEPARQNYEPARTALGTANMRLAEFEAHERRS